MANNRKPDENVLFSWIFTVIMLGVAWPIGLFMLFFVLIYSILPNRRQPICRASWMTCGWLLRRSRNYRFSMRSMRTPIAALRI